MFSGAIASFFYKSIFLIFYKHFRILIELLNMQVDASAIYKLLKQIRKTKRMIAPPSEAGVN